MRMRVGLEGLGHAEWDTAAGEVRLGDHYVPSQLEVTFPGDAEGPSLRMTLAVRDGVPECRDLRVAAKDQARGVRSGDLRAIRLDDWIEDLFAVSAMRVVDETENAQGRTVTTVTNPDISQALKSLRKARRGARRKITPQMLTEVADVYRENVAGAPTRAVADRFAVSHRTASLYVKQARDKDLLPPTTRGRRSA